MKITGIETIECDAGWRNYYFVKLTTDTDVVGWSEYDEGFGSPGVGAIINKLKGRVIGQDAGNHEQVFQLLSSLTRPAPGSVIGQALGAIENAMLDAKAKGLGVPCYELLGGKQRDKIRVYWSHCATWRINHPDYYKPQITDLDGIRQAGTEARERGFTAAKTNLFIHEDGPIWPWRPGFAIPSYMPELPVSKKLIRNVRDCLEALIDGAGPDVDILVDCNFNLKPDGLLKLLRGLEDLNLFWVELDTHNPKAQGYVRDHSRHPIASCETLIGLKNFLPYFEHQAMDVAIVDTVWNGVWQSMKIAAMADAHDMNIAPHNFYGDLCTMMNVNFAAAVPNLHIMETDVDRLPWEGELFTHQPEIVDGHMIVSDRPGWGTDPIEEALRARPPKGTGGLVNYKRD
ncbi:MAG: mandelate racemase/muconate lactonizing enzyme family protein [Rhodospirillaceae bacterium]